MPTLLPVRYKFSSLFARYLLFLLLTPESCAFLPDAIL